MPNGSGLDVLRAARSADADVPVIVMTAFGSIDEAVQAMKDGAHDFLQKPVDSNHLLLLVERALEQARLRTENVLLREEWARHYGFPRIIGESEVVKKAVAETQRVAQTEATVLLLGESGTGKELFARAVHHLSARRDKPFVAINCAAIPETLIENELFGHERGAFTGASDRRQGKFELASGGTVFLDEIGELPLGVQGKLLRAIEEKMIDRIGGRAPVAVDVRVVAATNKDLKAAVDSGEFRGDLFFRLAVFPIEIPPLRERAEDVTLLARHFAAEIGRELRGREAQLSDEAIAALKRHRWPGNVRELENAIERLVVTVQGPTIELEHLSSEIRVHENVALRPKRERRRTVAEDLYKRMVEQRESFWTAVYPLYMDREITRLNVRDIVRKGLEEARGNYKLVARLFNLDHRDYKRFLNFLRKHDCQVPFKEYR
jgi:DNA-binding NtrC family response regulator